MGRLTGQGSFRFGVCLSGIVAACLVLSSPVGGQMSESPLEKLDLPALDALANDIKARPAGAIDGLIMTQIKIVTDRSAALRRTTDQMELRQRRCGSLPWFFSKISVTGRSRDCGWTG